MREAGRQGTSRTGTRSRPAPQHTAQRKRTHLLAYGRLDAEYPAVMPRCAVTRLGWLRKESPKSPQDRTIRRSCLRRTPEAAGPKRLEEAAPRPTGPRSQARPAIAH